MPIELKTDSPLNPAPSSPSPQASGNGSDGAPHAAAPQPEASEPQAVDTDEQAQAQAQEDTRNAPIRWENGKCKIPLRKKVQAHGDMIEVLELREPTALDIERIGQPVTLNIFDANPRPIVEAGVMMAMLSHLAAVPLGSIRKLDPRDYQNASLAIFRFFIPDRWTAA